MKKVLFIIALVLVTMLASAAVEVDGIYYNLDSKAKTAEVTKNLSGYLGDIVIPKSFEYVGTTYSVTAIGNSAFYNCSDLISVIIPGSVISIGRYAFYGCNSLTSATIPVSVTAIGEHAFDNTGLPKEQSDGLVYLDSWLLGYKGEKPTGEITIVDGTKGIADFTFQHCTGLTSVTIPNSVTIMGSAAFYGCRSLTSVSIPDGVTSIRDNVFISCDGLISVTIPNSVTSIGVGAFANCLSLSSITIPNSITWQ